MRTRLNNIYKSMKSRCYCPTNTNYKDYGGRGITVCGEWLDSDKKTHTGWKAFKEWALQNGYAENMTIDRINNNKGYSPDNCRWVSMKVQANNKRNNRNITYKGRTQTLKQWCEELQLDYDVIEHRFVQCHWTIEQALETKLNANIKMIEYDGKIQSLRKWSIDLNIPYNTLYSRVVEMGWSVEKSFCKNRGL